MHICIEGNIGSGKSTVCEALSKDFDVRPEPIEEWREWLPLFYADRKRWAFSFQMKVLASHVTMHQGTQDVDKVVVLERSMLAGRYVFAQMLYNQMDITDKEWSVYRNYFDIVERWPDAIVYIKADPAVCMERIQERARNGENSITADYLHKVDFQYTNFLKYAATKIPVHVVDGNKGAQDVLRVVREIMSEYA
jgi:deoxyadenosine/deoxycytidine kinase